MDRERLLWAILASELDNQEKTDTFLENTNVELEEPENLRRQQMKRLGK